MASFPASWRGSWPLSSGQGPVLVGVTAAVPDLQLGAGRRRPVRIVEALIGLRIIERSVGLRDEDLRAGVVAGIQVHRGPVCGAAAVDVQALAEGLQRAARLDD